MMFQIMKVCYDLNEMFLNCFLVIIFERFDGTKEHREQNVIYKICFWIYDILIYFIL